MNKKFFYFLVSLTAALSASATFAHATSTASPTGVQAITLLHGTNTFFSIPLSQQPVYTGIVSAVTATTIGVSSTDGFNTSYSGTATPYFVQFISGQEAGRTLLVTASTSTSLTLDTTDHGIGSAVALNTSGFSVAVGDRFEIFPGDTLASLFGAGTTANPLVLIGSSNEGAADQVTLWTTKNLVYYFNKGAGHWELTGSSANANNTVVYPYSALSVYRQSSANATLLLTGQVTPANACEKVVQNANVYGSSHYATPVTLGQLKMGSNWQTGASAALADQLGIWNQATATFTFYYEKTNGNWYLSSGSTAVQNSVVIPPGSATSIYKKYAVTGGQAFLVSALPYSVSMN